MKTIKYQTSDNFVFGPFCMENPTGESMTIEGSAYTIQELLEKFTRGIYPEIGKEPIYDDDGKLTFDDVNPMRNPDFDLTDRDRLIAEHNELKSRILNEQFIQDKKHSKKKPEIVNGVSEGATTKEELPEETPTT